MKLSDKPCYPFRQSDSGAGLTFRERLIIAGMGNAGLVVKFIGNDDKEYPDIKQTNIAIIQQTDSLIKELENE